MVYRSIDSALIYRSPFEGQAWFGKIARLSKISGGLSSITPAEFQLPCWSERPARPPIQFVVQYGECECERCPAPELRTPRPTVQAA